MSTFTGSNSSKLQAKEQIWRLSRKQKMRQWNSHLSKTQAWNGRGVDIQSDQVPLGDDYKTFTQVSS